VDSLETPDLVRRAQRGDRGAFTELFRRHRADVARLVFRMTSSNGDRDDLVQEVFLQVHRSLGEFRGQSKFSTWVHRIAVNVVLMARRAAKSRPVFAAELNADLDPTDDPLPDEGAARARRIEAFRRLVDRLADKKRAVFLLHELEGLSPADISAIVDAPVLTVRTRLFYARRELTEWLREEPALAELVRALEGDASPSSSSKTRDRFEEET
jgi:RNA polymerase sigma-70 factor (ECF subfamily)